MVNKLTKTFRVIGYGEYGEVTDIFQWADNKYARWSVRRVKKWAQNFGAVRVVVETVYESNWPN